MGQLRWTDDFSGVEEEPNRIQPMQFGQDAALEDRLRRRDIQRSMLQGRIAPTRARAHTSGRNFEFTTLAERGVTPRDNPMVREGILQGMPAPADNGPWTSVGRSMFVNRDEISSLQNVVYQPRVDEISRDPSKAQNPRFPAGHELPHSVLFANPDRPRGFEAAIANGNHRIASEIDRGALFHEVRAIPLTERSRAEVSSYRNARNQGRSRIAHLHQEHAPKIRREWA
jgi:hypothetical protein